MHAKFQYVALIRFAHTMHRRLKVTEQAQEASEQSLSKERRQRKQAQQQLKEVAASAADTAESLRRAEDQLRKWKDRQPYINHYLGLVTTMSE